MIKLISLIFMLLAAYSEGDPQFRRCPPINAVPYHRGRREYVVNSIMESIVLNSTAISSNLTAGVPKNLSKWPKGSKIDGKYEIPYEFHEDFSFQAREAVYFGMVMIERGTNIVFIKKEDAHTNYILFTIPEKDDFCDSYVGKQKKSQVVRLASWCRTPRHVIHELLHAIGLKHEHQRTDRSISNGTWDSEKHLAPDRRIKALTPYDPFSIMHYALPPDGVLRLQDRWTPIDILLASQNRAFPSLCDYSAVNQVYKGHVQSPPCTNVRVRPGLLKATEEAERIWKELNITKEGYSMTWACNWLSGAKLKGVPLFSYERNNRTLCQFQANSMYPDFRWIPYAEKVTHPISRLNYSEFKIFPTEVNPGWMTHDICDCLGPPPPFESKLGDHSTYQLCLECVHFENTTQGVLKCIAKRTKSYLPVLRHLFKTYNQTQHYLIHPNSG